MNFKRHMKTHPLEYPCEICGKVFKRKDIMKRHTEIHLNERKYQCSICDKAFNTSSQLGMHKNKVHKVSASGLSLDEAAENVSMQESARNLNMQDDARSMGMHESAQNLGIPESTRTVTLHEMQPL